MLTSICIDKLERGVEVDSTRIGGAYSSENPGMSNESKVKTLASGSLRFPTQRQTA